MNIGIDLDNTINYSQTSMDFFKSLTNLFKDFSVISIITNRDPDSKDLIAQELKEMGIYWDNIFITPNKKEIILREKIEVYIDDTDEYFKDLPESVLVFKIREPGNFDFSQNKWVYDRYTGIKLF